MAKVKAPKKDPKNPIAREEASAHPGRRKLERQPPMLRRCRLVGTEGAGEWSRLGVL